MKVVVNKCFGGYALSRDAYEYLGLNWDGYGFEFSEDRTNKNLIECIEKLGRKANGFCSELEITDIPDGIEYYIDEYDGIERIHESHRSW